MPGILTNRAPERSLGGAPQGQNTGQQLEWRDKDSAVVGVLVYSCQPQRFLQRYNNVCSKIKSVKKFPQNPDSVS